MPIRTDTFVLGTIYPDGQQQGISAADQRDVYETIRAGRVWINSAWTPAEIVTELQAGGHVHFAAGLYDLTSIASSTVLSNSLRITGEGRDRVTIRVAATSGSPPGVGTELFRFYGSTLHVSGIKFIGDRVTFAFTGLTTRVDDVEIFDCGWQDTGALLKLDIDSGNLASAGTALGFVKVHRNHGRNLNSGVALRLGNGSASAALDVPIDKFEAFDNDFEVLDKYGIVCNYDDVDVGYVYASAESHAIASRNRITDLQGRTASTVTGFGINLSACRHVKISNNHLEDVLKGARVNIEAIYNKSFDAEIDGNTVANCDGDQGAIACKGGSAGHNILVTNNLIIATDIAMLNGIWVQAPNCSIDGNTLRGTFTTSAIKTGGSEAVDNLRITNNDILCGVAAGSQGIRVDTPCVGLEIKGNRIRRVANGAGTWRAIIITMGAGQAAPDPIIEDNTIIKLPVLGVFGAEIVIGIELAPNATGAITNPQILRNKFLNVNTGISLITFAITGTTRIVGNTYVGVTTEVTNALASVLNFGTSLATTVAGATDTLGPQHLNAVLRVSATGTTTIPAASVLGFGFGCVIVNPTGSGFTRTLDGPGGTNVSLAAGETATIDVLDNSTIIVSKGVHTVIS